MARHGEKKKREGDEWRDQEIYRPCPWSIHLRTDQCMWLRNPSTSKEESFSRISSQIALAIILVSNSQSRKPHNSWDIGIGS